MSRSMRLLLVLFVLSWLPWGMSAPVIAQTAGCNRIDILAQQAYTFAYSPGWTVKLSNDVRFMPGVGYSSDELWHIGTIETKLPLYPITFDRFNGGTGSFTERVENRSGAVAGILVICFEQTWTPTPAPPTPTDVPGAGDCGVWTIPNTSTTFGAPAIDLDVYSLEGVVQVWIGPDWLDILPYPGSVNNTGFRWNAGYMEDLRSSPGTPNAKLLVCAAAADPEPTVSPSPTLTPIPGEPNGCYTFVAELVQANIETSPVNEYAVVWEPVVHFNASTERPDGLNSWSETVFAYLTIPRTFWARVSSLTGSVTFYEYHTNGAIGAIETITHSETQWTPIVYDAGAALTAQGGGGSAGYEFTLEFCTFDPTVTTPTPTPTATMTPTDGPSSTPTVPGTATRTPRPTNTPIATQSIATVTPTTCNSCARSATQLALQETEVALLKTMVAQGTQQIVFPTPYPTSTATSTPVPVTIQFSSDTYSVDEDVASGAVVVTVTLSTALGVPVSVDYSTSDVDALAGLDYQRSGGIVTFDPGETEQAISIPITDDFRQEQPELIRVDLGMRADAQLAYSGLTLAPTSSTFITIFDNDVDPWALPGCWTGLAPEPHITLTLTTTSRLWMFRGEEGYMLRNSIWSRIPEFGTGAFIIPASTFQLHTAPDVRSAAFIVCPISDPIQLTPTASSVMSPTLSFTLDNYVVREDQLQVVITIQLAPPATDVVTVNYDTVDGSAIDPDDYTGIFDAATFQPGEIIKQLTIPIVDDGLAEPDEQFSLVLSDPVNALVLQPVATITIQSVIQALEVKFDSTNFLYTVNEDALFVSVQVELSAPAPQTVTVRVTLTEGSALYAIDYLGILEDVSQIEIGLETLVITFDPGEQVKILQIGIINDVVAESDEMLAITFSEPSLGVVLDEFPSSAIQIIDNDRVGGSGGGEPVRVPPKCENIVVEQPVSIVRIWQDSTIRPLNGGVELAGDQLYTLLPTQAYIIPEGNYLGTPLILGTVEVQLEVCPWYPDTNGRTSVAMIVGYEPFRSGALFVGAGQTTVARFNDGLPTADITNGPSDAQILPGATYQPAPWIAYTPVNATSGTMPEVLPIRAAAMVTTNLPNATRLVVGWAWPIVQFVRLVLTIAMLWGLWRYIRGVILRVRH